MQENRCVSRFDILDRNLSFTLQAIRKHFDDPKSNGTHLECVKFVASMEAGQETRPLETRYFSDSNKRSEIVLKIQFRIVYYLAVQKRPLSDFLPLVRLLGACGVFADYGDVVTKSVYSSKMFARDVLSCIATIIWWKTQQLIQRSSFLSVICDGSTDIANLIQLVVLYRIVLPDGKVMIVFGSIEEMPFGEDASAVVAAISLALKNDKKDIKRVPCFATDGASVMCGHIDGAAGRLLRRNRYMICHHCVCHRECLGCKAAAEEIAYLCDVFFPYIEALFRWFDNSPKRTAKYKFNCEKLKQKVLMIVHSGFTRWLSHDKVTEVLELCFFSVMFTLREDSDPAAQGLFKFMCTNEFIQCLLMMRDFLPKLASVNRVFQASTCDPIAVQKALQNLYRVLEDCKTEAGENYKSFDKFVAALSADGVDFVPSCKHPALCTVGFEQTPHPVLRATYSPP